MTEAEYRQLDIDSYSSIKIFIEDRKKYYRKFILKEPVKETESQSLTFGTLVDCLLFTPDEFDNKFALSVTDIPTGQYGKLVTELMKITLLSVNESGEVTRDVEDMLEEAYNKLKFDANGNIVDFKKDSFIKAKEKFFGTNLELYYRQLRESHGKDVIDSVTVDNALRVIEELKSNSFTSSIINATDDEEITVYNQFPIVGKLNSLLGSSRQGEDVEAKCLVDKLIINHSTKYIDVYDLKTVWDNEGEFISNYFKYKYYIQAALYMYLIMEWKATQPSLNNYIVNFPYFIAADSSNYKNPLIYMTSRENFEQGMRGFTIRGKYYPGVIKAVTDMLWHKRTGIWNISRENYENSGIVRIKPFEN